MQPEEETHATTQLRRSALYVPGINERALEKAKSLPIDVLVLDLEDAVAPDAKAEARYLACAAAASSDYAPREVAIRINAPETPWHAADIRAVAQSGAAAIVVPKVYGPAEIESIEDSLARARAPKQMQIWAMLETPAAVLHAAQIVTASDRLTAFLMGTNDLANELGARPTADRQPLLFALAQCLTAVRMAGKTILDGVFVDIHDQEGFAAECLQGRQLGFDGKTLIHPNQIEICNRTFAPSASELEWARKVIAAFEAAQAEGRAVATVEGRLIEHLHVERARRDVSLAKAIRERSS